jgi:hypothetical protein
MTGLQLSFFGNFLRLFPFPEHNIHMFLQIPIYSPNFRPHILLATIFLNKIVECYFLQLSLTLVSLNSKYKIYFNRKKAVSTSSV